MTVTLLPPEENSGAIYADAASGALRCRLVSRSKSKENAHKQLTDNKESLFYLNSDNIPQTAGENAGKNVLKFAMQNQIKLIYGAQSIAA